MFPAKLGKENHTRMDDEPMDGMAWHGWVARRQVGLDTTLVSSGTLQENSEVGIGKSMLHVSLCFNGVV